ncbi:hypothetical protein ACFL5D_03010, partial [Candidatus Neomarinimicrobiota bacterium]
LLLSIILFLVIGCTKLGEPTMHPINWTDPNSENSHMTKIIVAGTEGCKSCHGDDYLGGTSDKSCYQCHAGGISGHPAYSIWVGSPNSTDFHGEEDAQRCMICHGDDYLGGTSGVSCYQCHDGPNGYSCQDFTPPTSTHTELEEKDNCEALHMPGLEDPLNNNCSACHGSDLTGGSAPSCFICHGNRWDDDDD